MNAEYINHRFVFQLIFDKIDDWEKIITRWRLPQFPLRKRPKNDTERHQMIINVIKDIIQKTNDLSVPYTSNLHLTASNCNIDGNDPINECDAITRLIFALDILKPIFC